jgi:acetylornithine deacetylase/succinyl-diaminopimelate desuccinylase-like protein
MRIAAFAVTAALLAASPAAAQPLRPDQAEFRALYKELVETNTTLSEGDCTLAAKRMLDRLAAAGIPGDQLVLFKPEGHPREGMLVVIYPGTNRKLKPMLLLAHIDVVEARRSDWQRDPFTLIEEDGYFFARGSYDDKAQAAIFTDTLIRFARAGHKPRRTIKLALTCGEETTGAFNGAEWLTKNRRELIDAAYALNEGGPGRTDNRGGKLLIQTVQVGEKAYQDFTLTATNDGGHSSVPIRDNAIYAMGDALARLRDFRFPLEFNDTTRAYFARSGAIREDALGKAMVALATNPDDTAAEAIVSADRSFNALLRTTCVATLIEGGHALNALPQTVKANVNCRMFPGRTAEETQAALTGAIGNPAIRIEPKVQGKPIAQPPPLDPAIIGPMERLSAKHFPEAPLVPAISTGATDGLYFAAVGIPVYGIPGLWRDPDNNGVHGLDERIAVDALYRGRDYMHELIKMLSAR